MQTDPFSGKTYQTHSIGDHVLPICSVSDDGDLKALHGTAFLIGARNFALTAAHCIPNKPDGFAAMFVVDGAWYAVPVLEFEVHPTEDVALLHLKGAGLVSIFSVTAEVQHQSARYRSFGYPDDTYYEVTEVDGLARPRPDLVYTEGHVRRRITRTVDDHVIPQAG